MNWKINKLSLRWIKLYFTRVFCAVTLMGFGGHQTKTRKTLNFDIFHRLKTRRQNATRNEGNLTSVVMDGFLRDKIANTNISVNLLCIGNSLHYRIPQWKFIYNFFSCNNLCSKRRTSLVSHIRILSFSQAFASPGMGLKVDTIFHINSTGGGVVSESRINCSIDLLQTF